MLLLAGCFDLVSGEAKAAERRQHMHEGEQRREGCSSRLKVTLSNSSPGSKYLTPVPLKCNSCNYYP